MTSLLSAAGVATDPEKNLAGMDHSLADSLGIAGFCLGFVKNCGKLAVPL